MKQLILAVIFFSATTYAQDGRYSIRTHFGYSLSNIMTVGGFEDFKSTFNVGVEVQRRMGKNGFYLQSGIRWNEYGYCYLTNPYLWNGVAYVGQVDYNKRTSFYLSVPLIATWKLKRVSGFTISAGPQLSYLVSRKVKIDKDVQFYPGSKPLLQYSAHFSVGYERPINDRWMIGAEAYTNSVIPGGFYNFGIGISSNYVLN